MEAIELGQEAVRMIAQTDELDAQGNALIDLAEVLRAADRVPEAREHVEQAVSLYERKGNIVSAKRARQTRSPHLGGAMSPALSAG